VCRLILLHHSLLTLVCHCLWTYPTSLQQIEHVEFCPQFASMLTGMKKRSERRKHCTLAVARRSQKNSPRRRPLPGGAGRPRFNQLEMVTTFTYKPILVRIDACSFELSWSQTHKHTDKTDYNTLRRPQLARSAMNRLSCWQSSVEMRGSPYVYSPSHIM